MSSKEQVSRWKCTSYCLCGSRKGHFERRDDGVWVRYEDIKHLLANQDGHRNEEPSSSGGFGTTAREPSSAQSPGETTVERCEHGTPLSDLCEVCRMYPGYLVTYPAVDLERASAVETACKPERCERLRDCETSLSTFDPGDTSEYWLKYMPQKIEGCPYCAAGDGPCVGHGGLQYEKRDVARRRAAETEAKFVHEGIRYRTLEELDAALDSPVKATVAPAAGLSPNRSPPLGTVAAGASSAQYGPHCNLHPGAMFRPSDGCPTCAVGGAPYVLDANGNIA